LRNQTGGRRGSPALTIEGTAQVGRAGYHWLGPVLVALGGAFMSILEKPFHSFSTPERAFCIHVQFYQRLSAQAKISVPKDPNLEPYLSSNPAGKSKPRFRWDPYDRQISLQQSPSSGLRSLRHPATRAWSGRSLWSSRRPGKPIEISRRS
jgi:hypothetical protein